MRTGTQGVIDPRDVADVAAHTLTSPGHHGHVYTLTGPELLSIPDMAARLGDALGRTVHTVDIPLEDYHGQLTAAGLDPRSSRPPSTAHAASPTAATPP